MLPHPSMAFAWEEAVVRPTRALVVIFVLAFIVMAGTTGLIASTGHDRHTTVAVQHDRHLPIYPTGR